MTNWRRLPIAQAGVLASAVAVVSLGVAACEESQDEGTVAEPTVATTVDVGTGSEPVAGEGVGSEPVIDVVDFGTTIPSESLQDWINLADAVVVGEVIEERLLEPQGESEPRFANNEYVVRVSDLPWVAPGFEIEIGDEITVFGNGWHVRDEDPRGSTPIHPWLETGERYVMPIATHPDGLVGPLGPEAIAPVAQAGAIQDWVLRTEGGERVLPSLPRLREDLAAPTTDALAAALDRFDVPVDLRREYPDIEQRWEALRPAG